MSETQRVRAEAFRILREFFGLDEAEAAIIICAANSNHPIPKEYLIEQAETFLRETSESESLLLKSKIVDSLSALKKAGILRENHYFTPFECYYICSLDREFISKLKTQSKISEETSVMLLQNLNSLAKQKQEIGWLVQDRVGLPQKLRNFDPTRLFYDINATDGSFSFEESRKYIEEFGKTSEDAMRDVKPHGEICIKTFFAGWLVRKLDLVSEKLAKGVSFSLILLPRPPGSGKQEWTENVKLLSDASRNYKHKLKLKIWPADIENYDGLMLQMTLIDEKHAFVSQRRLGDIKICAPCYTNNRNSVNETLTLFRKYQNQSLLRHLLKVSKQNISPKEGMIFGVVAAVLGALIGTLWSFAGLIIGATIGAIGGAALAVPFTAFRYLLEIKWPLVATKLGC